MKWFTEAISDGNELVDLNMMNALKYVKVWHETEYAELMEALNDQEQAIGWWEATNKRKKSSKKA